MAQINQNTICLVSGGGRGITAQAAIALAQQYQCKFILLGRSAITQSEPEWAQNCDDEMTLKKRILEYLLQQNDKPTPKMVQREYKLIAAKREIEQTLHQISQAGGQAEYLSVDVTDAKAVGQKLAAIESRLGKIKAIVHGAGNLADKPIEKKTASDFDLVYAPKVKGLENLLDCINPSQLDCLVLFSSVVGFYGNAGQTDYAIANEILNKTAYLIRQKYPQCHTVAINWGPWDSGMVSLELKRAFAKRNIKTIPVDAGTQMLVEELAPDNHEVQVVIGSPLQPPATEVAHHSQTYQIQRRLSLAANPFLHDHVIMDRPVLPATCAIAWIANTCEQLYPGYTFFNCCNFKVLKGIIFDANLADKYILDLTKKAANNSQNIDFDARIWSKDKNGKVRYHFNAKLNLISQKNDTPQYNCFDLLPSNPNLSQQKSLYQAGATSLFHGACFQGVKKVLNVDKNKLTAECYLTSIKTTEQGQFPVQTFNPYIVDVKIHALWLWLQHNHQEICLPSEIITYEQFTAIPFDQIFYVSCEIKTKTKTAVVANLITHDQNGKIYSRMLGAKGTIISF
jgi:NAD(P)-dependent dehydrogenase (short-subunit alcohol dehydrogenase family)